MKIYTSPTITIEPAFLKQQILVLSGGDVSNDPTDDEGGANESFFDD